MAITPTNTVITASNDRLVLQTSWAFAGGTFVGGSNPINNATLTGFLATGALKDFLSDTYSSASVFETAFLTQCQYQFYHLRGGTDGNQAELSTVLGVTANLPTMTLGISLDDADDGSTWITIIDLQFRRVNTGSGGFHVAK